MSRPLLLACAVLGFSGVALGAFGSHGLKSALAGLPEAAVRLATWETGARYHLVHALAVGIAAILPRKQFRPMPRLAGAFFTVGVVLFSGSLYALALTNIREFGAVTPLGGLAFLGGWLCLGIAAFRRPSAVDADE
jgi:uncharacterized membrane protein YgdD (TMEM256/DUF423 family)